MFNRSAARRWAAAAAGLLVLFAGASALRARAEAQLLRADPDTPLGSTMRRIALAQGQRVFRDRCAGCHGVKGRGGTGPDLTDGDWIYGAGGVGEIEQIIAYGIRSGHPKGWNLADMPAYASPTPNPRYPVPQLGPQDIDDLVAYLRGRRGAPSDPAAAARGRAIFTVRAGCYDCHAPDARGDPAVGAPNLTDDIWLYGGADSQVADSIVHGRAGRMPALGAVLSAAEIREAALYVHSLSQPVSR